MPASWVKVREGIESRAANTPYISRQAYFDIYCNYMDFDRSKALHLSRYLHDLGVFLHFQDDSLLERTIILQNEWATEAVFKILDDETVKRKLGRFNGVDCERLWQDSIYFDMPPELLALMQRFELCYQLSDSTPPTWLAPQLLPPSKPKELHEWNKIEDLVLRYRYDFLPKGIISRLTVRLHRFVIDPEMAWVTGVLFEYNGTKLLVELMTNGTEIELRAKGPERKELLSVIAAGLDALNESFRGLRGKVDKRIPCNCKKCRVVTKPIFFNQSEMLRRKEHKKMTVECLSSFEEVDVIELLDGISVIKQPGWSNNKGSVAFYHRKKRPIIKCFISYAHFYQDYFEVFRDDFHAQTFNLSFCGINIWTDEKVPLGDNWHKTIQERVASCDIAILLISDRFMSSDYIEAEEVARLFERKEAEGTLVISVYFYPCRFHDWPFLIENQLFKPKGEDYGRADQDKKNRFCFADIVRFDNVHGKNIAGKNPDRSRYMMDFVEALEPRLKEIVKSR